MKNKSKYFYKRENDILDIKENQLNTISDSINNVSTKNNKQLNYFKMMERKNSNEIYSPNGLSFLIYSSNKETNKNKKDALFGNLLSLSKEKGKSQFNSYLRDSIQKTNSFLNINKYIENNLKNNNNFFATEKNKLKLNESQLKQISSIKNKNNATTIKKEYNELLGNELDFSLNDYLNSYKNDENFDNNFSSGTNAKNSSKDDNKENINLDNYSPDSANKIKKGSLFNTNNKNNSLEVITEEKHKDNKFNAILNETLFNTKIKEKISKIKEDVIVNNNIKKEINSKKNKNYKLKIDQNIDYYEYLSKELEKLDESKLLEDIFKEFLSDIKFRFLKKDSFQSFKDSLNNCKLYELLKLENNSKDSNIFDNYISNIEFSTNKNISNSIYNSKSELLREASHSFNDSQSSQTIENQMEKNYPLISKFPKLVIPQSIIPEESSNFLYSNNENILNRSFGEAFDANNVDELKEVDEYEEDNLYEENIKKELDSIEQNCEINISHIFVNMKMNNVFGAEKKINSYDVIKEYKAKIFYDILLISQENDIDISQENNFGKIIKGNL